MRIKMIRFLVLTLFFLNASVVPIVSAQSATSNEPVRFEISPGTFERSKEYTVVIRNPGCGDGAAGTSTSVSLEKARVESTNGVNVLKVLGTSPCSMTVKIGIEETAQFAKVPLPILDEKEKLLGHCICDIVAGIPGPIPPGLEKPQVDLLWSVLPDKLVDDAFGERVRKRYYGIEVVIGNNSGYDLQIASVGFNLSRDVINRLQLETGAAAWENRLSASGYRLVRAAIEKTQEIGKRNRAIFLLETAAGIGTGGIPFFRNATPRANYSTIVSIFSNPLLTGLKLIFPDRTISQFTRLDDLALRSDFIISNNTQVRRVVFFPKEILCDYFKLVDPKMKCDNPSSLAVMKALGELVLVGQQIIRFENRIRVVSTSLPKDGPGAGLLKTSQTTFQQGSEKSSLTITGSGLKASGLTSTNPGIKLGKATVNGDGTQITAEIEVDEDVPVGEHKILVNSVSGYLPSTIRVTQKPVISQIKFGAGGTELAMATEIKGGITITVTGKNLQYVEPSILDSRGNEVSYREFKFPPGSTETKFVLEWQNAMPVPGEYKLILKAKTGDGKAQRAFTVK